MKMEPLQSEELRIDLQEQGDTIHLNWVGKSEARDPGTVLTPYLMSLAKGAAGKKMVINFHQLEYMNSSTVMPIIHFIKELDANKIPTTLFYNSSVSWQRMSFEALRTVSTLLNHVRIEGKG